MSDELRAKTPMSESSETEKQSEAVRQKDTTPKNGGGSRPRYGLELILGILAILGAFFSAFLWIENRYAHDSLVKKIEQRLDIKITNDQLQNVREQIWKHEDRLNIQPVDKTARELLRSLRVDERDLEKEIDTISKRETE